MAQSHPKTRKSSGSKISDYLGAGKDFLPSEVPTLRGALRKAILMQEELMIKEDMDRRLLPISDMMNLVADSVIAQWQKRN